MIKIKDVKDLMDKSNLTHVVVFGVSGDLMQHIASHGRTVEQGIEASKISDSLKTLLDWPENTKDLKPLERICSNCELDDDHHHCPYSFSYPCENFTPNK